MKIVLTTLLIVSTLMAKIVYSHSGATGVVKQRMDAMDAMGDQSKLVADMFKGRVEFNKNALSEAAESFSKHGSTMIELFPDTKESRKGSQTEALPKIWEEWDDFSAQVTEFVDLSDALKKEVATTDDKGQLKKMFFKTTKSLSLIHI